MHGAAFFASKRGGAEEDFFGVGRGVAGANSSGWARVTVKLGTFLRRGKAVLKTFGAGAV